MGDSLNPIMSNNAERRRNGEMVCLRCGDFSSAMTCTACARVSIANYEAERRIAALEAKLAEAEARARALAVDGRTFPIQGEARYDGAHIKRLPPVRIPWAVAELAYRDYSRRYRTDQGMERLAERGGFGRDELIEHLAALATPATPDEEGR